VAAPGQRHDESPGLPPAPRGRVKQQADIAEVHLGLIARLDFDAHRDCGRRLFAAVDEAPEGGVGAGKAMLALQSLPDGLTLQALRTPALDQAAVRFDRRRSLGRGRCR